MTELSGDEKDQIIDNIGFLPDEIHPLIKT